jgi:hypothetical protein
MQPNPAPLSDNEKEGLKVAKLIPLETGENTDKSDPPVSVADIEAAPQHKVSKLLEAMCCWAHSRM